MVWKIFILVGLITEAIVSEITEKRVLFNIKQTTITKINLKNKNGEIIKQFEAGERGYVSEKDINRELIHEKEIDNQTLVYRERVSIKGTSLVQILD